MKFDRFRINNKARMPRPTYWGDRPGTCPWEGVVLNH